MTSCKFPGDVSSGSISSPKADNCRSNGNAISVVVRSSGASTNGAALSVSDSEPHVYQLSGAASTSISVGKPPD